MIVERNMRGDRCRPFCPGYGASSVRRKNREQSGSVWLVTLGRKPDRQVFHALLLFENVIPKKCGA